MFIFYLLLFFIQGKKIKKFREKEKNLYFEENPTLLFIFLGCLAKLNQNKMKNVEEKENKKIEIKKLKESTLKEKKTSKRNFLFFPQVIFFWLFLFIYFCQSSFYNEYRCSLQ
jgi:hypothetical protein